jgi:hypothetical protein
MMKKIALIILLSLSASLSYGQTLEDFFIHGAVEYIQLSKDQRIWLLKRHKENIKEPNPTLYNGVSEVKDYKENNLLTISTSEQGNFSVKRWLTEEGITFGVRFWACGPICDGWIKFVSTNMDTTIVFPKIWLADFVHPDSLKNAGWSKEDFEKKVDFPFYHYEFTEGDTIKIFNNTPKFLSKESANRLSGYWKNNVIKYIFKENNFKKVD